MVDQRHSPLVVRLRRATFVLLALGPILSLGIVLAQLLPKLSFGELINDPGGLLAFLFLLLGPYLAAAGIAFWLARSPIRAILLTLGAVILSVCSTLLWYEILVRDGSPLAFLALISIHWLQLMEVAVFGAAAFVVWLVEQRFSEDRA